MKSIKDIIYFDYDKAKSLNSQLNGGIINEITRAIEEEGSLDSEIGFDLKIIKGKLGGGEKEKTIKTERIELYHELLNEVEDTLKEKKILKDLNISLLENGQSYNDFLQNVPNYTYVKATGWSSFEDFERFKRIMSNFNEIQRLIFASALQSNPEILQLRKQINDLQKDAKISNSPSSNKEIIRLKGLERNFDKILEEQTDAALLDETFIERLKTFLNTFTPNRLNFRLSPFDIFNDFQILANLKSQYLVNGDFENVIFTYGSRPNIKLTVFGIITSCPQKIDLRIDQNNEYDNYGENEMPDEVIFEKAFRRVFSSFENFENFFFVPTFPKIAISPIAIYREIIIE
jgi:hypothetical protein